MIDIAKIDILTDKAYEEHLKDTIMIWGSKNSGKTTLAFNTFKGRMYVFSFDRKAIKIKEMFHKGNDDIMIIDAVKYFDPEESQRNSSSMKCINYVDSQLGLIKQLDSNVDWVMLDAFEVLTKLAEGKMRAVEKIPPFGGVAQRHLWNKRNAYVEKIYFDALSIAKKGVIITSYPKHDRDEDIIRDGDYVRKNSAPAWFGRIKTDVDVVVRTYSEEKGDKVKWLAKVEASKIPTFESGKVYDVTNKGIPID